MTKALVQLNMIVRLEGKAYRAGERPDGRLVVERYDSSAGAWLYPTVEREDCEAIYGESRKFQPCEDDDHDDCALEGEGARCICECHYSPNERETKP